MVRRRHGTSIMPILRYLRPRLLKRKYQMLDPLIHILARIPSHIPSPRSRQTISLLRLHLLSNRRFLQIPLQTNPAPPFLLHLHTPTHRHSRSLPLPVPTRSRIKHRSFRCSLFRFLECRFRCLLGRGRLVRECSEREEGVRHQQLRQQEELLGQGLQLPLARHLDLVKRLRI